ncbi:MAG: class I SAM-dependent methyltransferase [Candidatus Levybacteria bacterium]|nr:class I SAM-dependent methyltransferase [Candidatus Levybacteria bacterium]
MKIKYDCQNFNPNNLSRHNINRMVVDSVNPDSFVLDLGCATGFMGEYLIKKKNCDVLGVDISKEGISLAKKRLTSVLIGDIEDPKTFREIEMVSKHNKFDVVMAVSVLEHLKDPQLVLINIKSLLKKDGLFIITCPNIAHWTTRTSLLKGNFNYTDYGILDKTHLHFYTPKTLKELIENTGFKIKEFKIDAEGGGYPRVSLVLSHFFPNFFTYQMMVIAGF